MRQMIEHGRVVVACRKTLPDSNGSSALIGQPGAVCWPCEVQTWGERARGTQIDMHDEACLREPPTPEPGIKVEHTWICKENDRLIWRIKLAQNLVHEQPREPALAVVGMRRHCPELVAFAHLASDHIPHRGAPHRADDLVVNDHRKDAVSSAPAATRAPGRKCTTARREDRMLRNRRNDHAKRDQNDE